MGLRKIQCERLSKRIMFRITDQDYETIKKSSQSDDISISKYIRTKLLNN